MLDRVRLSSEQFEPRLPNATADQDAAEIGVLYRDARAGMVSSIRCLIEAGKRLATKKAALGHGQWLPWLANNADELGFDTPRTAQRLMDVASKCDVERRISETEAIQINREIWGNGRTRGLVTGVGMDSYAERGNDLYETPPGAVRALLDVEKFEGPIWEPACGPGSIVRVLRAEGHRVVATDLVDYGCPDSTGGQDFFQQQQAPKGVRTILTNPPFMHADDFVRHALKLVPRVALFLRLAFLETESRSDILDGGQLARVLPFRNRVSCHRHGFEGEISDNAIAFAWFVWDRAHEGFATLQRISWREESADG
jgi:Protein of unknown function (DUF3102)